MTQSRNLMKYEVRMVTFHQYGGHPKKDINFGKLSHESPFGMSLSHKEYDLTGFNHPQKVYSHSILTYGNQRSHRTNAEWIQGQPLKYGPIMEKKMETTMLCRV